MSSSGAEPTGHPPAEDLREWLIGRVAELSGREPAAVDPAETFAANGLDSVRIARLATRIATYLGRPVEPGELFEHPTVSRLLAHLTGGGTADPVPPPAPGGGDREPVAIVGMACRFPGAPDLAAFWDLLTGGVDAVRPVPAQRWGEPAELVDPDPAVPGRMVSPSAGLLDDIAGFDAEFFRIAPDEAARMDPQQRLLLEICWDALEDAGTVPASVRGTATGVFVGISGNDYAHRQVADRDAITRHTATANSAAVAANRLSYVFDLRGPSLAVDTACSSSLVAVHLAVRALRSGDCDRAVVGGVNALLDPAPSIGLSKAGMLAPDGRCKPFDGGADGYVRGEGCGLLVLRRLCDAVAEGDRVYAVIRGSAANSDGASNGLTAPNPAAQREVLRAAYADAATVPGAASYVECHGTGTALGDAIEARSLAAVRAAAPGLIGSVKSNLGHLEAAAGIAGMIKTALAVHHGVIPPGLHFREPNPAIPFDELGLAVVTAPGPWPDDARICGVSSFGFGGTNAHVVLAAPDPAHRPDRAAPRPAGPLAISLTARSRDGLARLATATADAATRLLSEDPAGSAAGIAALARTMTLHRTRHRPFRAARVVDDPGQLPAALRACAAGAPARAPVPPAPPAIGFVFSGQGSQWAGMGRDLLTTEPLFASVVRRCDEAVADVLGWSIAEALAGGIDVEDTAVAQVLIVAVQLGMVEVLRSLGVRPAAVAGHSVGEIAAAVAAGALDLAGALRLAVTRGRLMGALGTPTGGMLAVDLPEERARERFAGRLQVAAVNAPAAVVLGGPMTEVAAAAEELAAQGRAATVLDVRYAFHTTDMAAAAGALAAQLAGTTGTPGTVPLHSTVRGRRVAGPELDAAHWAEGVRGTVRLYDAITGMLADGVTVLLEIGPRSVLQGSLTRIATQATGPGEQRATVLAAPGRSGRRIELLQAAAELDGLGVEVDWRHLGGDRGPVVAGPGHPWERRRHWIEPVAPPRAATPSGGPLLGAPVDLADDGDRRVWQSTLGAGTTLLDEHRVHGRPVLPAAAHLELLMQAGAQLAPGLAVVDVQLLAPLLGDSPHRVQCTVRPDPDDPAGFHAAVHSRPEGAAGAAARWREHVRARLVPAPPPPAAPPAGEPGGGWPRRVEGPALYEDLRRRGLDYGPAFRRVVTARVGPDAAVVELAPAVDGAGAGPLRPRVLDAALHATAAIVAAAGETAAEQATAGIAGSAAAVPVGVAELVWWQDAAQARTAVLALRGSDIGGAVLDVDLLAADREPVGRMRGLRLRRLDDRRAEVPRPAPLTAGGEDPGGIRHYALTWREQDPAGSATAERPGGRWLVVPGSDPAGPALAQQLADRTGGRLWEPGTTPPAGYPDGVVHLAAVRHPGEEGAGPRPEPLVSALESLRAVALGSIGDAPRLVLVTRGAQPVADTPVVDPHGAALWGLARTIPLEHPGLGWLCIDLDPDDPDPVATLQVALRDPSAEAEVGYRFGRRFVRRIVTVPAPPTRPVPVDPDGGYLVTGGTGALGLQVARRLVARGARHVVLLARHATEVPLPPDLAPARRVDGDVGDPAAVARAVDGLAGVPLRGVVHAAGVLENAPLLETGAGAVRCVLAPKAAGAWNLHRATAGAALDFFVLFASAAGVLGSPGQGNYGAANAQLDALARYRRDRGLPAVAIDWGPWAQAGMAADWDRAHALRTAASALDPEPALEVFETLAAGGPAQHVVLPFDLADLTQFYPAELGRSFLAEVTTAGADALRTIGVAAVRPALAAPYVAPRDELEHRIVRIWQRAMDVEPVGVLDGFFELGGDSVMANQILVEMNRVLGVTLTPGRAFEDFTVAALAAAAQEQLLEALDALSEDDAAALLREPAQRVPDAAG